ncbi:MAG: hypothetical protein AAGK04_03305 [Planctomycetota bacterium]
MDRQAQHWRRTPRGKPNGAYVHWSDADRGHRSRLLCTWLKDWHKDDAAQVPVISPHRDEADPLLEKLCHRCPSCKRVWNERFDRPVDVTLLNQTYGGDPLTGAKLRNVRLALPLGSVPSVVRVETLDRLRPHIDDGWLVGDVFLVSGERLGGFRSVVDRYEIPLRKKFHKEWFKYHGSARFRCCDRCGAFDHHLTMGGDYILASEAPSSAIRLSMGSLVVERSLAEKLDLFNKRTWPGGSAYVTPVYEERLDPIPSPYPRTWNDLVEGVRENGDFPFEVFGRWTSDLRKQAERGE